MTETHHSQSDSEQIWKQDLCHSLRHMLTQLFLPAAPMAAQERKRESVSYTVTMSRGKAMATLVRHSLIRAKELTHYPEIRKESCKELDFC